MGLTHLWEAPQIFTAMQWKPYHSGGICIDLSSEVVGITVFPSGVFTSCADDEARLTLRSFHSALSVIEVPAIQVVCLSGGLETG